MKGRTRYESYCCQSADARALAWLRDSPSDSSSSSYYAGSPDAHSSPDPMDRGLRSRRAAPFQARVAGPELWILAAPTDLARGFFTLIDAVDVLSSKTARKPRAIVIELRDQDINQEQLQQLQTAGSPLVALGGSLELNDPLVREFNWTVLLNRPVTLGTVAAMIQKLVPFTRDIRFTDVLNPHAG